MELVLAADDGAAGDRRPRVPTDLVVVLDRSGSMASPPAQFPPIFTPKWTIMRNGLNTVATAKEMAQRGTFRGATTVALVGIAWNDEVPEYARQKALALIDDARSAHRHAVRAGVRHVVSTDAGTPFNPHGNAPNEVVLSVEWGSSPLDAMVAATANGAELLRLPDVGTVDPGKIADLVLYDANPVDDPATLRSPRIVWQGGRVVARGGKLTPRA